ncbi:hypothetical protein KAFR_0L01450 [Kazachstania africana CBS 2517]|uniref:ERAD-associated E3 ubiquitin-protein ligase component HRD3 n=1 Tax=Kazachstania africana (strain ATCC 22294 / BCRC 22015 / CBS 2517 / CECT 1963 / NBRC 1671 / NRRL Y-8276) TaxID=1071382 RepID=H2B2A4_KAZAF|nr:hypothetical protein KAFR_0L01450 [Kazachstania africana CBS 2517]CCF60754.1 hypothetical protein KAFR_0L01450 [Kazachstania africana CBS 2517]
MKPLSYFLLYSSLIYSTFAKKETREDPWNEITKITSSLPIRPNPFEVTELQGDISFYIPIDYFEESEESKFNDFWLSKSYPNQIYLYNLLTESSENYNNANATFMLSRLFLYQHYNFPHNKTLAHHYLNKYNELTSYSDPTTLFEEAVMHSTGLFGTIPVDPAKALLYYERAARAGSLQAKQALAYKYFNGINVPRDFDKSLVLYREVAESIKKNSYSDYDWNVNFPYFESYNVRLPDFEDGLLGPGLGSTSLSTVRKKSARPDITSSVLTKMNGGTIILQFGNVDNSNAFAIGDNDESEDQLVDIFYTAWDEYKGTYTKKRDVEKSRLLLEATVTQYDKDVIIMDNLQRYFYSKCLDLLGHIYFTGDGLPEPDLYAAENYLKKAILVIEGSSRLHSRAHIDMGLLQQYKYHNETSAVEHYRKSIELRSNNGIVEYQLAKLNSRNPSLHIGDSFTLLQAACTKGFIPAIYEFAKMTEKGLKNRYNCEDTAYLFKLFVEENESIMAPHLTNAFAELLLGNTETALWEYTKASEQGYEMAQVSAAYLMYQIPTKLDEPPLTTDERKDMAITYYMRAFKQNNVDAGVIAGDVYYDKGQYEKAFSMYQSAALKYSVQAIWNLGYMYEYGLGVPMDFHLAKRYYDQVLEFNHKFYLGVKLSVLKLRIKSFWIWIMGNQANTTIINPNSKSLPLVGRIKNIFDKIVHRGEYGSKNAKDAQKDGSGTLFEERNPHKTVVQSGFDGFNARTNNDQDGIAGYLQSIGLHSEDVITILFVIFVFSFSFIMRTLAQRRGWNVQINGIPINPNNNNNEPQQQQGGFFNGNFDVQIFAI